ncbi:MAG: hypothetical protein FD189_1715 [Elusimicrobia bacterium]|nr:MAG: hypothetical protein FD154_1881 [Elusimicrobiota bacterium]KAF0154761.1 MAG: hypothetical protein FD189_1715 [Elusimicrobiota bacterium]
MSEIKVSSFTLPLLILVFLSIFTVMVWPYLVTLLMGVLLAILTRPLHEFFAGRGAGPRTAASLSMLIIMLAIIGPLVGFAAAAINQGIALADYLSGERGAGFLASAVDMVLSFKPLRWAVQDPAELQEKGRQFLASSGGALSKVILVQAAALPEMALKIALAILTWFFLLVEGGVFANWLAARVPMEAKLRTRLAASFRATAASTVWATSAAAAAQALVVMAGFWLLDVPGIFLAGGATFIFAWIPILGSMPVCLAGAVYLYFAGSMLALAGMGVVAVIAGLTDNVVRPIVLKGSGDMHPLLALVSIFAGIRMFGILGVIFGPIVAAMLLALLNSTVRAPAADLSSGGD